MGSAPQRNKWREVRLKLTEEGDLGFANWRNFKSSLEESLVGVQPPQDEDLREHVLKQLPQSIRREIASRESSTHRNTPLVTLRIPPTVPRPQVLEQVGEELGLRLRDDPRRPEYLKVECLTEAIQAKALGLDGQKFVDAEGRVVGTLGVEIVRSNPLSYGEICATIESRLWSDVEFARMPQAEKAVEKPRTKVQKVETQGSPATSPNQKGGKGSTSPRQQPPQGSGRGRSKTPPKYVCYCCQQAGRPFNHFHQSCPHWQEKQKQRSPTSSPKPPGGRSWDCLTCLAAGRPANHLFQTCPEWMKASIGSQKGKKERTAGTQPPEAVSNPPKAKGKQPEVRPPSPLKKVLENKKPTAS